MKDAVFDRNRMSCCSGVRCAYSVQGFAARKKDIQRARFYREVVTDRIDSHHTRRVLAFYFRHSDFQNVLFPVFALNGYFFPINFGKIDSVCIVGIRISLRAEFDFVFSDKGNRRNRFFAINSRRNFGCRSGNRDRRIVQCERLGRRVIADRTRHTGKVVNILAGDTLPVDYKAVIHRGGKHCRRRKAQCHTQGEKN